MEVIIDAHHPFKGLTGINVYMLYCITIFTINENIKPLQLHKLYIIFPNNIDEFLYTDFRWKNT